MTTEEKRPTVCTKLHEQVNGRGMRGVWLPSVTISRAKEGSRNPGALYIKSTGGLYYGKIQADGSANWINRPLPAMEAELRRFATEGAEYLAEVGKQTGACSFCGKLLTDPESVEHGYGPVCARKYGLPHGNRNHF